MYTVQNVAVTDNEKRYKRTSQFKRGGKPLSRNTSPQNSTEASKRSQHLKRVRAFMLLGGKCQSCSDNRMAVLELEHRYDNGADERRQFGRGAVLLQEVFKRPNEYQLLCGSCHNLKTSGTEEVEKEWHGH